jgi:predicted membrane protein
MTSASQSVPWSRVLILAVAIGVVTALAVIGVERLMGIDVPTGVTGGIAGGIVGAVLAVYMRRARNR